LIAAGTLPGGCLSSELPAWQNGEGTLACWQRGSGNLAFWHFRNLATRQRYIDETFGDLAIQQIGKGKMVYWPNGHGNMVDWEG
jgi:hypothetical protein